MKTKDMTKGHSAGLILKFALPLIAGNVFQELYTITDTAIVGQFLGVKALAAVGGCAWITWMLLASIQGLTQGFSVPVAQEFGAGNIRKVHRNMANSLMLSVVISVILVVLGQWMLRPLLELLETPDEIIDMTLTYARIYYLGAPIMVAYNYAACHLRALGNSSAPLKAMIIASVTNIILDILFVGPFGWGIVGAITATLIAQVIATVYSFRCLLKLDVVKFVREDFTFDKIKVLRLLYLGVPMLLQNVIICLGGFVVQYITNTFGLIYVAAFTATGRMYSLIETAGISYGYAITTYVGQNMGAGNIRRISHGVRWGNVLGIATAVIIGVALIVFGRNLLTMFIKSGSENFEETMYVAYFYLKVMCTTLPILYILHVYRSALNGLGNGSIPMFSGVAELVMRVSSAMILPELFGRKYLTFAEPIAWFGAVIVLVVGYYVLFGRVKKHHALSENKI